MRCFHPATSTWLRDARVTGIPMRTAKDLERAAVIEAIRSFIALVAVTVRLRRAQLR